MSYIVQADLDGILPEVLQIQLTDDEKLGVRHAGRIEDARLAAEAEFEEYAGKRYVLPIASISASVKRRLVLLWRHHLYSRRTVPAPMIEHYEKQLLPWLRDIAAGRAILVGNPAPTEAAQAVSGEVFGPERVFDRDKLKDF